MADFTRWGPIELKISLGELSTVLAAIWAAYWVGKVIQGRQANDRAVKDLMTALCREALDDLAALSKAIESGCQTAKEEVESSARYAITRCMQRFSNSVHSIELAAQRAALKNLEPMLAALKTHRENLHSQITDPLVTKPGYDDGHLRQIEGTVRQARESLIVLQLDVIQRK